MEGEEASRLRSLSFKMDDLSHQGATALEVRFDLSTANVALLSPHHQCEPSQLNPSDHPLF